MASMATSTLAAKPKTPLLDHHHSSSHGLSLPLPCLRRRRRSVAHFLQPLHLRLPPLIDALPPEYAEPSSTAVDPVAVDSPPPPSSLLRPEENSITAGRPENALRRQLPLLSSDLKVKKPAATVPPPSSGSATSTPPCSRPSFAHSSTLPPTNPAALSRSPSPGQALPAASPSGLTRSSVASASWSPPSPATFGMPRPTSWRPQPPSGPPAGARRKDLCHQICREIEILRHLPNPLSPITSHTIPTSGEQSPTFVGSSDTSSTTEARVFAIAGAADALLPWVLILLATAIFTIFLEAGICDLTWIFSGSGGRPPRMKHLQDQSTENDRSDDAASPPLLASCSGTSLALECPRAVLSSEPPHVL